jgi:GTP-binding protein
VPVVCLNKIDRPDAQPSVVLDEIYGLFIDLGASEELLEFPIIYTNARAGTATLDLTTPGENLRPLFAAIVHHLPGPLHEPDAPARFQANNLSYDDYVGRLAIGRVVGGELVAGGQYTLCRADGSQVPCKLTRLYGWHGLKRIEVERALAGDIVAVAGIEDIFIGDTIADRERPMPLPPIRIDEPTIAMLFGVNTSPWAGRSGSQVTSRKLRERLIGESRRNVSIRVDETETTDTFRILGRGELQLAILIETMRREGYEMQVSKPSVVVRERDGVIEEPMELLLVDVPEDYVGIVTQLLGVRRGVMSRMDHIGGGRVRIEYTVPSRGLIGFRSHFLTDTRGTGTINALFNGWARWHGAIPARTNGAMVSDREGVATPYALFHLQERGVLFVPPGTPVYEGHDRRRVLARRRPRRERLPREEAHQHACLGARRGRPPRAASDHGSRGRPRVDRRGRARGGHARDDPAAQEGAAAVVPPARAAERARRRPAVPHAGRLSGAPAVR